MAKKSPSSSRPCTSLRTDFQEYIHGKLSASLGVTPDSCDPRSSTFTREGYLIGQLFSKLPGVSNTPKSRAKAALDKFLSADARNARSNERLLWGEGFIHGTPVSEIFDCARQICTSILGKRNDYVKAALAGSFSGGASTSKRRGVSTAYFKFREQGDITIAAMPYFERYRSLFRMDEVISKFDTPVRVVDGNIFFTVPKNAETDRGACKEPDWNMFFQKGIGDFIRARLCRVGCDLNDQTLNQRLAHAGSLDGSLATIDLSAASDSNSFSLIERVVPYDLFKVLCDLRCEVTKLPDGTDYRPNMFSSMGNGFTFELESLVFLSLTRAICYLFRIPGRINVYGDDIIAPTAACPMLLDLLGYCGHRVNVDKTFTTGFFRESCGKHFHKGIDVTPIYVRKPLESRLFTFIHCKNRRGGSYTVKVPDRRRIIHLHNRLMQWGSVEGIVDPRLDGVIRELRDLVPTDFWGGRDVESIDALITPDLPRMRYAEVYDRTNYSDEVVYLMNLNGSRTKSTLANDGLSYCDIETRKERKLTTSSVVSGPGLQTSVTPRLLTKRNSTWCAKQYTVNDIPRLVSEV